MKYVLVFSFSLILLVRCSQHTVGRTGQTLTPEERETTAVFQPPMSPSATHQLLARVTAIEDRLAIQNLLAGSAFSSDIASEAYWTDLFAEDAVMDRGQGRPLDRGRDQILKVVGGPDQREAIKAGMTHLALFPHIRLDSDKAVAIEPDMW